MLPKHPAWFPIGICLLVCLWGSTEHEAALIRSPSKRASGFRPVVIVHGILDSALALLTLKLQIEFAHPNTDVYLVPMFQDIKSAWPMWTQVAGFSRTIREISDAHPDGIILLGYSQGGLICRGVIQADVDQKLNVHTFISLASPQMGQYGDTSYLYLFPGYLKGNLYKILYSRFGQTFSVGGYWKDPHHYPLFQAMNPYLALLNNETSQANPNMTLYKSNFTRLRKLVLIGGPDDGVVTPWQSSHFGFFDATETVVEMHQQPIYLTDAFGLRTLDERGDLILLQMAGVKHTHWHLDPVVFREFIEPWLS